MEDEIPRPSDAKISSGTKAATACLPVLSGDILRRGMNRANTLEDCNMSTTSLQ